MALPLSSPIQLPNGLRFGTKMRKDIKQKNQDFRPGFFLYSRWESNPHSKGTGF